MKTITLDTTDKQIVATFAQRLDDREFSSYRNACRQAGYRYNGHTKSNAGNPARAAVLAQALTAADFEVVLTPAARDLLAAHIEANSTTGDLESVLAQLSDGLTPRPYQLEGVSYLQSRDRALLHDDMGLGKTIQVLLALPLDAAAIAVVPSSTKGNWANECKRWRPDLTPVILNGRKSFRWPAPGEFLITNYEILSADTSAPSNVTVIADEAHRVKGNPKKVQRARKFRTISAAARKAGGKTWLLTGTPMLNRPGELWNVLQTAEMGYDAYGSYEGFMRAFNAHRGYYGIEWGELGDADEYDRHGQLTVKDRAQAVEGLARVAFGRRKSAVASELPAKVFQTTEVEISKKAARELDVFRQLADDRGFSFVDGEMVDAEGNAVTLEDLAGDRIVFEAISAMRATVAAAKIPALLKIIDDYEASDEPLVVFSAHLGPVMELAQRPGWGRITGDMSAAAKTKTVEKFQAGELKGVACTNAAIEGITLTRASHMIFVDRFWTPGLNAQAQDRIHRIGQERTCFYTDLVADHALDHAVLGLLRHKEGHLETVTQAAAAPAPKSPQDELAAFLASAKVAAPTTREPTEKKSQKPNGVPEFAPLVERLQAAAANLRFPKLRLEDADGNKVIVGILGDRSSTPGHLKVTSAGSFETATFYGRVAPTGRADARLASAPDAVIQTLRDFCANPEAAVRVQGQRTGTCACCGAELTNKESIAYGIGPICRDKWGF